MLVHVINLPHRTDRIDFLSKVAKKENIDLQIHEGVYFHTIVPEPKVATKLKGHVGCLYAHKKTLIKVKGTAEYHIILEDDVDMIDWLIENPERFKPNKPSIMLADEFLKSRQ